MALDFSVMHGGGERKIKGRKGKLDSCAVLSTAMPDITAPKKRRGKIREKGRTGATGYERPVSLMKKRRRVGG